MDVNSIIHKSTLELDEVIFVVEQYILERKGRTVKVGLESTRSAVNPFEFQMLLNAYNVAAGYFINKQIENEQKEMV
jgi:hypothetical protein